MRSDRILDAREGLAAKIIDWGLVLMTAAVAAVAMAALLFPAYDWDVHHELYFAQRLLQGEWLWMREFHDKLPAIQLVFLLPAWFSSKTVWYLMSLAAVLGAALVMIRLLPQFTGLDSLEPLARRRILWFGALVWTAWMLGGNGGIAMVNTSVASLQLISLMLILHLAVHPDIRGARWLALALIAGFAGALAISIRPYLVGESVLVVLLALAWRGGWIGGGSARPAGLVGTVGLGLVWALIFLFWGGLLNVLPYAASGQMAVFWDGIAMLAAKLNPNSALSGFKTHLSGVGFPFYASFFAILLLVLTRLPALNARVRPIAVVMICAAGATFVMFLTKHYWAHYSTLLVGSYVVLLVLLLGSAARGGPRLAAAVLGVGLAAAVSASGAAIWLAVMNLRTPADAADVAIVDYMSKAANRGHDFLVVFNMTPHWLLRQSRHGFPHASNTRHIYAGWWKDAPAVTHIFAPRTGAAYCARLLSDGPELVFDWREGNLVACLTSAASPYRLDSTLVGIEVKVFRRQVTGQS